MISCLIFSSLLVALLARAQDSSIPCITGTCTYQAGDGSNTAYSVLTLNTETPTSLSDITEAAGWAIVECDPYSTGPQDIRLVCTDRSMGCDHLFEGGEENTIVRLPDSCAGGPFARVVRSWIPEDQTLPARLLKRQIDAPVRALTLDFDFSQIPESNGKVYLTASATNSQAQRDVIVRATKRSLGPIRHAKRISQAKAVIREFVEASEKRLEVPTRRGFFDSISDALSGAVGALTGAANQAGNALGNAGQAVASDVDGALHTVASDVVSAAQAVTSDVDSAAQAVATAVDDGLHQAGDSIGKIIDTASGAIVGFVYSVDNSTSFNETRSENLTILDVDQSFPIITKSLGCPESGSTPAFDANITITADVKAKLDGDIGFIVVGGIVPPHIDDLAFTSTLNGNVTATFDLKAAVKGTFDTGLIPLLRAGLPGLTFPGILTVGPFISLNAQAKTTLGVTADVKVSSTFDLPQVHLVFPPSQGQSAAQVIPQNTPVSVDVGTSIEPNVRAEVHIIPRLDIGVEILDGAASTTVFLEVDGSAGVDLMLSAGANATPTSGTGNQPVVSLDQIETTFGGCVDADVGVSINAGATADLPPFFDKTVSVTLFQKTFPLFSRMFGNPATRRSTVLERADLSGLICPALSEMNIIQPILNVTSIPQQ